MSADARWDSLVPAIRAIYAQHAAGCCWHVVLDDGNYDADCIAHCVETARNEACRPCLVLANQVHLFSRTQLSKAGKNWRLR